MHRPMNASMLADHLTFIEQIKEDKARFKTRLEHIADKRLRAFVLADIARLEKRRAAELARLVVELRAHADLANKLDLVLSIPGIGARTALAVIVRMPELGQVARREAAALAGLAPFVHQSGKYAGQTHIGGGRGRLRPRSMRQPCRRPRSGIPHVWRCMNAWWPTAKSRSARWWPAHASC